MNSDEIREQAIETAAKAWFDGLHSADGEERDDAPQPVKAEARHDLTPLVDAVLAVAGPAVAADALDEVAARIMPLSGAPLGSQPARSETAAYVQGLASGIRNRADEVAGVLAGDDKDGTCSDEVGVR